MLLITVYSTAAHLIVCYTCHFLLLFCAALTVNDISLREQAAQAVVVSNDAVVQRGIFNVYDTGRNRSSRFCEWWGQNREESIYYKYRKTKPQHLLLHLPITTHF